MNNLTTVLESIESRLLQLTKEYTLPLEEEGRHINSVIYGHIQEAKCMRMMVKEMIQANKLLPTKETCEHESDGVHYHMRSKYNSDLYEAPIWKCIKCNGFYKKCTQ